MRTTKASCIKRVLCVTACAGLIGILPAGAYESYEDPSAPGAGYCANCHTGFLGGPGSTTHDQHTALTSNCSLCHTGSGRANPLTMWSQNNQLGCTGCHGQDYGETIQANYRGFATQGLHKQSAYGLRRHHARAGVDVCADCHNDANVAPYAETVINPGLGFTTHYYTRSDVNLNGSPISPCNDGLDNDGDGLYDAADPDCAGTPLNVSFTVTSTNTAVISWPSGFDGWHVQVSSAIGAAWTDLPDVPHETGSSWVVVLGPVEGTRFYRVNKKL